MINSFGGLLSQVRPDSALPVEAFTPSQTNAEVTTMAVCNTTGNPATFSIYHNDDDATYNDDNAVYKNHTISANDTVFIETGQRSGLFVKKGGSIGVQSSVANALNFSIYGVAQR